jgi:hypothetical protein
MYCAISNILKMANRAILIDIHGNPMISCNIARYPDIGSTKARTETPLLSQYKGFSARYPVIESGKDVRFAHLAWSNRVSAIWERTGSQKGSRRNL